MASDNIVNVGDGDFDAQVIQSDIPVLVDFWATWCAPCRAIAPHLDALSVQYQGRIKFTKLNIDDNQDTPQAYGIRSIPTLLIFKGGKVIGQIVGAVPRSRIEAALTKLV